MNSPLNLESVSVAARRLSNFLASHGAELDAEEALAIARGAVALAPLTESHNALAGVLNDIPGAEQLQVEAADKAIADDADNWAAWHNKSLALLRLHRSDEAAKAISTALRLLPAGEANPYLAMQAAFVAGIRGEHEQVLGYLDEAEAVADRLNAGDPRANVLAGKVRNECCIARFVAYANLGKWAEAFAALANRFNTSPARDMVTAAARDGKLWKPGTAPKHENVIVVLEWGLGDQIQFARYVPELVRQGVFKSVSVACSAPLSSLMVTLDGVDECRDRDALNAHVLDSYEVVPVLDLMADYWLRTGDPVGGALGGGRGNPYLKAPGRSKSGPESNGKPNFAFSWQGDPRQTHDWNRRLPLAGFGEWAAANRERFNFISLQTRFAGYGEPWAGWHDDVPVVDASAHVVISDMGDVADWIERADVVVAQCGGLVHLAGALGKPAIVMLAASHDWRWDQSPALYASVMPVVQSAPGDWSSAFAKLGDALVALGVVPPPLPVEVPAEAPAPEPVAAAAPVKLLSIPRRPSPTTNPSLTSRTWATKKRPLIMRGGLARAAAPASIISEPAEPAAISTEGETQQ